MSYTVKLIVGLIGTAFLCIFIGGLSQSISSGFAGFKGGAPFMIIAIVVCGMAVYDFYDECIRRNDQETSLDYPPVVGCHAGACIA